ncbi:MAG: hypothetical protein JJT94_06380 [Bernardetiaceae bacterium]|nr:hypothetical protein [Bernardetiaceae bacterium]
MSRFIIIFSTIILLPLASLLAQEVELSGKILTTDSEGVFGASVMISMSENTGVLAYDISKEDGQYHISIVSDADSFLLKVTHISYQTYMLKIANQSQNQNIVLEASEQELEDIVIEETQLIQQRGDTLVFNIEALKGKDDRVLADVLKRLPGIEITENGSILYEGKTIIKYYIEGLDLLEGRYGLANNNLPIDAVESVELIQDHQPIQILDGVVASDRAAVNVRLKSKLTLTGRAKLGIGAAPLLWEAEAVPMLFSKKQQAIGGIKTNNVGQDVTQELRVLTPEEFESLLKQQGGGPQYKSNWLATAMIPSPLLPPNRWLDNRVFMLTTNYLKALGKDYELKVLASYTTDKQKQQGGTNTEFIAQNIKLEERLQRTERINRAEANFILSKNIKQYYLKNETQWMHNQNRTEAHVLQNQNPLFQTLENPSNRLRNKLKLMLPIGKNVITFYSHNEYYNSPEQLALSKIPFPEILLAHSDTSLNHNIGVLQKTSYQSLYSNQQADFILPIRWFVLNSSVGFDWQNQGFISHLNHTTMGENSMDLDADFQNNLQFNRSNVYVNLGWEVKKNNWVIRLKTPLSWRSMQAHDSELRQERSLSRPVFEPNLYITKSFNSNLRLRLSAAEKWRFAHIGQSYFGFLLHNYRSLKRYDTPFMVRRVRSLTSSLSYKNPISHLFFLIDYELSAAKQNLLLDTEINSQGAAVEKAVVLENLGYRHKWGARANFYITPIKATCKISTNYSLGYSPILISSSLNQTQSEVWNAQAELLMSLTERIDLNYKAQWFDYKSFLNEEQLPLSQLHHHKLLVNFFLSDWQFFGIEGEFFFNYFEGQAVNNQFLNLKYRYTWQKRNIDFELQATNLLNTSNFTKAQSSDFAFTTNYFLLRPRQLWATVGFNF